MDKPRIYSEFETFYSLFKPLTPYGRAAKEKRMFFSDKKSLDREYSLTDSLMPIVLKKNIRDKLRFHLRNIPLMKLDYPLEPSVAELFLARKFISGTKAIFDMLPEESKNLFGAKFSSVELLSLLDKGGNGDAFYIADCYSKDLAAKRKEILVLDFKLKALKQECFKNILEKYCLDFASRDFLIMLEKNYAAFGDQHDLYAEPHDLGRVIVKPVFSREYLSISAQRDNLRSQEAALEKAVVINLTSVVNKERNKLISYRESLMLIDIAAEKARLAMEYGMSKPEISDGFSGKYNITLKNASFIPLKMSLAKKSMEYTPFSAEFTQKINILYGSNMGGKTVALKTFVFFQMLAQSGFFVPAEIFSTHIFKGICFIGGDNSAAAGGLSSFGVEMNDFVQACTELEKGPVLFIMDEFARTTNSEEGAALIGAILRWLDSNAGAFVFMATHLSGINAPSNTAWFKMKGFNREAFRKYFDEKPKAGLDEKLKSINRFMCYEMQPGNRENESRDAIKIAGILGVDKEIISIAEKIIGAEK